MFAREREGGRRDMDGESAHNNNDKEKGEVRELESSSKKQQSVSCLFVMLRYWQEAMAGQHYCLRWNNYQSNMTSVFHHLLRTEAFVDVTLACNEYTLKAHKVRCKSFR